MNIVFKPKPDRDYCNPISNTDKPYEQTRREKIGKTKPVSLGPTEIRRPSDGPFDYENALDAESARASVWSLTDASRRRGQAGRT